MRFFLFFLLTLSLSSNACTTFALKESKGQLVGNSLDWYQDYASVYVNLKNLKKTAFAVDPRLTPVKWTSKFGSITVNQYGRELPLGGINEAGLVIENMWLTSSKYPDVGTDESINELQWIQYNLDRFDRVSDVLAETKKVKLANVYGTLHYLVCDTTGECGTVEYINKEVVTHPGTDVAVLTNDTYDDSIKYLKGFLGFGGTETIKPDSASLDRFVRASLGVKEFKKDTEQAEVAYAFKVLDSVRQQGDDSISQLNLVYDRANRKLNYRSRAFTTVKSVSLKDFDYSCKGKAKNLDVNQKLEGDVASKFVDYSPEANKKLVDLAFEPIKKHLPEGTLGRLAKYQDSFECME